MKANTDRPPPPDWRRDPGVPAAGILLSAGASRRMGRVKALLPHPDGSGRTLIRAAAETAGEAGLHPLFVVLGYARSRIAPELRGLGGMQPILNPAWRSGMLSSLQVGVRAATQDGARWALVCPVDQPFLSADLIHRLRSRAGGSPPPAAVVPATEEMERAGRWSLPVLLGASLFPEILAAPIPQGIGDPPRADIGARRLLVRHRARIATVRADSRELLDLDTPSEFERARAERELLR